MKKTYLLILSIGLGMILAGCSMMGSSMKMGSNDLPPVDEQNIHMCLMGGGHDCDVIMDPANKAVYGAEIQKICTMMPMDVCTTYFATTGTSDSIQSLPEVKPTQIVKLNSGDVYPMTISWVKMKLGGKRIKMLAYNGMIPGPTLQAPQGSHVTLRLTNQAPDLITTLHSHGVRLSDLFDGVPKSMMGAQDPMNYGDSFDYELTFPDAGLYWYHPHMDEQIQQELGLYGNYLVTASSGDKAWSQGFSGEHVIILDDIQLTADGTPQVEVNPDNQMLMGRYGATMLINGSDTAPVVTAVSGQVVRLYLTNVANVRPFNITVSPVNGQGSGNALIKLIGSDVGLYEKPVLVNNVLIGPAERYIVDVYFPHAGQYQLINTQSSTTTSLTTFSVSESKGVDQYSEFMDLTPNSATITDIDHFRSYFDKAIDKSITLDMTMDMNHDGMMGMMGHSNNEASQTITMPGMSYDASKIEREDGMKMMNDMSSKENTKWKIIDDQTKKENMDINRSFKQGDVVKVHITNKANSSHPMQHPIHFHGQRFLVLTHNGVPNTNLVWKDTVLLGAGDGVDILIDMSNIGSRMAHCHIAEHLMDGMMMHFEVLDKNTIGSVVKH